MGGNPERGNDPLKGVKPEELDESDVLIRLESQFAGETLSQAQVIRLINLLHVTPKFVCESRFGFKTMAGGGTSAASGCRRKTIRSAAYGGLRATAVGMSFVIGIGH